MKWDRTKGRPEPISALNRIAEIENGEPLVDIREYVPSLVVLRETAIPYCRLTVAKMTAQAAQALPDGIRFGLVEGWRPLSRQQRIFDFITECVQEVWPERTGAALRRSVCRWVAPTDQKAPPGHCTGAALDLYLVYENGETIDVWSPLPRFQANPTYVFGLSPESLKNRMILADAMLGAGFSNCRDEWWHYSWGDAGWAVRMGYDTCCYGAIELDPELWEAKERLHAIAMADRVNPFKS